MSIYAVHVAGDSAGGRQCAILLLVPTNAVHRGDHVLCTEATTDIYVQTWYSNAIRSMLPPSLGCSEAHMVMSCPTGGGANSGSYWGLSDTHAEADAAEGQVPASIGVPVRIGVPVGSSRPHPHNKLQRTSRCAAWHMPHVTHSS